MRKTLLVSLTLCGWVLSQSFFNTQGLGELSSPADAAVVGMGGTAALSYLNPGFNIDLSRARFTGTTVGAGAIGSIGDDSRLIGTARPAGFHTAVPLPFGTHLLLNLTERFNQDFDVWTESTPGRSYRHHVVSRGGIYGAGAGLAWSLPGRTCVGIEYTRLLGTARENWSLELSGGNYASTDTIEVGYSANAFKAGASVDVGRVRIGAAWQSGIDLVAQSTRHVHGIIEDSIATYAIALPHMAVLGVGVHATNRLDLNAGFEYRPWSSITVDGAGGETWQDAWRASAGAGIGLPRDYVLRVGYSYQDFYFRTATDNFGGLKTVSEHRLHLGTSIPIPKFGSLDIAAEIARRGNGHLTETAGRLLLSLSYHEGWLKRTRRWGS